MFLKPFTWAQFFISSLFKKFGTTFNEVGVKLFQQQKRWINSVPYKSYCNAVCSQGGILNKVVLQLSSNDRHPLKLKPQYQKTLTGFKILFIVIQLNHSRSHCGLNLKSNFKTQIKFREITVGIQLNSVYEGF